MSSSWRSIKALEFDSLGQQVRTGHQSCCQRLPIIDVMSVCCDSVKLGAVDAPGRLFLWKFSEWDRVPYYRELMVSRSPDIPEHSLPVQTKVTNGFVPSIVCSVMTRGPRDSHFLTRVAPLPLWGYRQSKLCWLSCVCDDADVMVARLFAGRRTCACGIHSCQHQKPSLRLRRATQQVPLQSCFHRPTSC